MKELIKPKFPAIDLSLENWDVKGLIHLIVQSDQFNSASVKYFTREYLGHEILDCNRNVFKVQGYRNVKGCRIIPFFGRMQIDFEFTGKKMDLDEIKSHFLTRIKKIKDSDIRIKWTNEVNLASSFYPKNDCVLPWSNTRNIKCG